MTLRFVTFILVMSLSLPALAETALVRSGEHDGFSRIVIDLPQQLDWNLQQTGDEVTVRFTGQAIDFDIRTVFDKIPRTRVTGIVAGPADGALTLTLGCACELTQFWHGAASLVIDIHDSPAQSIAKDMANTPRPPRSRPAETMQTVDRSPPKLVLPLGTASRAAALTSLQFPTDASVAEVVGSNAIVAAPKSPGEFPFGNIAETRVRLLKQIGRAATQGLLSPQLGMTARTGKPATEMHTGAETPEPDHAGETGQPPADQPETPGLRILSNINLTAQSSIDRDFLSAIALASGDSAGSGCLSPAQVDVAYWGSDSPFSKQIGTLRVRLTEEFDKTNEEVAKDLAKLYLYFGFGTEARQILTLIEGRSADLDILHAVADILETGYAPDGSVLSRQLDCGPPVSLWSVLSYRSLPVDVPIDEDAVLRGFNALPIHLRGYLGPVLSRRFLEAGRQQTAERVLRIVNRNEATITPGANLVQAEIDIDEGDHEQAENMLQEVVTTNSEPSADALLKMIEIRLLAGQGISFETAQLAGAYAFENRDEPIGRALYQAYVVALAASGAFDQSYEELARVKPILTPDNWQVAQSEILKFLTADADEMTFLRHVFADRAGQPELLETDPANATATRLLKAGFIDKARQFVAPPSKGVSGRARAILRAEISLQDDRPRQAEVDLLGVTGADADLLRARARSLVGEHQAASQLFASGDRAELAERESWLAEDWGRIGASDNPVLADVAMLMTRDQDGGDLAEPVAETGVLARNRTLLEVSAATRGTIAALLLSKPVPDAPSE